MPYIPTENVESSNIEAIGYHRQSHTLRIIFHGGRAYDYPMVPESEYNGLMKAESKGKFFNSRVKPMYGHRIPRPEELQPPGEEEGGCGHTITEASSDGTYVVCVGCGADLSSAPEPVKDACGDHPNGCPEGCPVEPDRVSVEEERTDLIDGACRCCGVPLKITPEDAVDLCVICYHSKGGDTDEPCKELHLIRVDCPHGADGRDCEEGCICSCHRRPDTGVKAPGGVDPVDYRKGED